MTSIASVWWSVGMGWLQHQLKKRKEFCGYANLKRVTEDGRMMTTQKTENRP